WRNPRKRAAILAHILPVAHLSRLTVNLDLPCLRSPSLRIFAVSNRKKSSHSALRAGDVPRPMAYQRALQWHNLFEKGARPVLPWYRFFIPRTKSGIREVRVPRLTWSASSIRSTRGIFCRLGKHPWRAHSSMRVATLSAFSPVSLHMVLARPPRVVPA